MTPVLTVDHLGVRYGANQVLHDVSFSISKGELIAIIGPNGAGKSTMFKAICGLVNHEGDVDVNGVHCHDHADRMDLAYIPQRNDSDLHFPITVGELVLTGRRRFHRWYARPTAHDRAVAAEALERVMLAGTEHRALTELSGGQLQRAYVARALAQQASVVLLDEALSGVDQPTTAELLDVFESLAADGTTMLVATHDLALARRRFRRCIAVNGTVRGDGPPAEVLSADVLDATFGTAGHRALAD
ncbi:MAG: metal ABC transporter ATP-binding protein [Actinomycetota bacterium]